MVSYMESDYVMKFEVYDYNHDITKTHVIFSKEPDMKPHGCSTKNPSTIRAHVIIMNFLETIRDHFKTNKISCRMNDILDSLFNSAPGILSSPTITLVNFDYNYHTNHYKNIKFILEDKQVCYSETFLILSVLDKEFLDDNMVNAVKQALCIIIDYLKGFSFIINNIDVIDQYHSNGKAKYITFSSNNQIQGFFKLEEIA